MGEEKKKQKRVKKQLHFRTNLLFFITFFLFITLIGRLAFLQIVHGENYVDEATRQDATTVKLSAPRGEMYDRHGRVVVDNKGVTAVLYTVNSLNQTSLHLEVARKLSELLEIDTSEIKERDIKDYWLVKEPEKARELISKDELELSSKETYALQLERIPAHELEEILLSHPEEIVIYKKMTSGYIHEAQIIKSTGLSNREIAAVVERLDELPGVDVKSDWQREYPYGEMLKPVLGGVTTEKQGILEDRRSFYMTRGYSRNERVGKSYLEYQYEETLHASKGEKTIVTDKQGDIVSETLSHEGVRGRDLRLSINAGLQQALDATLIEEMTRAKSQPGNHLMDRAFIVMMDPYNGDILGMSGKMIDPTPDGKLSFSDYSVGTFTSQYEIGSTIKGATILAGYDSGVIAYNHTFYDAPITLAGLGKPKSSWKNFGRINDLTALKVSSNVYMFHTVMNLAGVIYRPGGGLPISEDDFTRLRNYYAQFGLGVKTGIDLPNESAGLLGNITNPGLLLDMSIGQFDTYTPLQMAQYVSTIANGGYRVQPRMVASIHEPVNDGTLGPLLSERPRTVLNRISNRDEDIQRVQEGFRLVTQSVGGTANNVFSPHDVSGKTGTAQTFYYGPDRDKWGRATYNLTFVGYYPSDKPKVAFSVVVPWVSDKSPISKNLAKRAVEAYIEHEERLAFVDSIDETIQVDSQNTEE
ncbi:peptidoglycan D,D-transpeptidase FtsI family protein [Bacillus sp. PS06]|uniref:peptidoglycan D,D-transpeptidase FtsI family protein n=1 Tax=Bacillus sp. PS06 TaxID=2764176 RepID=UPI00177FF96F|nr:penicillin-binding protein 2 [Bacillus sp. PS06]MBD8071086.1 penicillin-binding protein 2 [Bacillus sp. PS06]